MIKLIRSTLKIMVLSATLAVRSFAEQADTIKEAITMGNPEVQLRLGYEYSSTDDSTSPANALNLRLRLGYRTLDFFDTNVFVQFHGLTNIIEDFRFPGGGENNRDIIADPDGERIHQGYIEFKGLPDTVLRLGRQEIVLDDARLIGNINWRQNGQSFDAFSLTNTSIENLTLTTAIVNQVNTIVLTHDDLEHLILLHAKYMYAEDHHVALFGYLLDTEISTNIARDSATYGLRANGQCGEYFSYDATYAMQDDYQDGKNHDGDMVTAFAGTNFTWFSLGVGYQRISGKDGNERAFDTLFSTAHKFNGWADQFLSTNSGNLAGGLEDLYVQIGTIILDAKISVLYHRFETTENEPGVFDENYGDEIDIDIKRKLTDDLEAQIRYAHYNESNRSSDGAANPTTDEDVLWARLNYQF